MQFIFPFLNAKGFPLIVKMDPTVCKTLQIKKSSSFELGMHLSLFQAFKNTVQNFATRKIRYFQIRK
jgi:hypothetical protein